MAEAHEQPQGPRSSQPDPALATVVQEGAHAPLPNHARHGSSLAPVVTGRSSGGGLDLDRDILPRESPSQSQATVSVPTATPATPATTTTTTTGIAVAAAAATTPQLPPLPPPPPTPPPLPLPPPSQQRPRANDDTDKAPAVRLFDEPLHQQQKRQEPSARAPAQAPPPAPASQAQAHYRRPPQGVPAAHAQSGEGTTSTDGFPRNCSPARARPTSPPIAAPSTLTTAAATAITVATERPPTSAPTISVLTNGTSADHARQSGFRAHSPTPKAMSNPHHHQPGPPRQPIPYPSPTYAAPTLSANYGWAQGGQPAEAYRTSPPTGAPSMSLPSMRTFDALQQQQQHQQTHQPAQHPHQPQHQHHHMSLASPVTQMPAAMQYYAAPPMPLPGNYAAFPADTMPRYALPPGDPRALMASGRHKKEIKRRTKTGCLTCRKRRIKCDEQHPVCKNCQKSRRDCMGYDPIFKQQQQHPTNIQPAPNHPAPSASVPSNGPLPPASTPLSSSSGSTYTPLPPVHSGAYMPAPVPHESLMSSHLAALEANALSSVKTESVAESASAVDPSLDSAIQTPRTSTSHSPGSHSLAPTGYDQRESDIPHLRGGGADVVAYHPSPEMTPTPSHRPGPPAGAGPPAVPVQAPIPATTGLTPRKMRVHELIGATFSAVPPKPVMPTSEEQLAKVRDMFSNIYTPGLEELFETTWYSMQLDRLLANEDVTALLVAFMDVVERYAEGDPNQTRYALGVESRVVWALACLGYSPNQVVNAGSTIPGPHDEVELRNRVAVVDALLAGDVLARNPLQHTRIQGDDRRIREIEFWWYLGEFLCIEDKPQQFSTPQREDILHKLRSLLDGRENRDLLYSIAVIRAFGPHWPPESDNTLPPHHDEVDPRVKLSVARRYIYAAMQESESGGTTNVARRIAELGYLAYIQPGVNIPRLPAH